MDPRLKAADDKCVWTSLAAGLTFLYGRAGHRSVGTVDAAIASQRFEKRAAASAFVKPLAGVSRHGFGFGMLAFRTSDG